MTTTSAPLAKKPKAPADNTMRQPAPTTSPPQSLAPSHGVSVLLLFPPAIVCLHTTSFLHNCLDFWTITEPRAIRVIPRAPTKSSKHFFCRKHWHATI